MKQQGQLEVAEQQRAALVPDRQGSVAQNCAFEPVAVVRRVVGQAPLVARALVALSELLALVVAPQVPVLVVGSSR